MKLKIVSDLHLEFQPSLDDVVSILENREQADILAIIGDTYPVASNNPDYIGILAPYVSGYEYVLAIPGNHEYYGTSIHDGNRYFHDQMNSIGIIPLNNTSVEIDGIQFFGTPLWSNIPDNPIAEMRLMMEVADYKMIRDLSPNKTRALWAESVLKLDECLDSGKPTILLSHNPPTEAFLTRDELLGTIGLCTELPEHVGCRENLLLACHGHIHKRMIYETEYGKPCYCNPYGYYGIGRVNNQAMVLEID